MLKDFNQIAKSTSAVANELTENPSEASETAALLVKHFAKSKKRHPRLTENNGELAKILIQANPRTASAIAYIFAETKAGQKILSHKSEREDFFAGLNSAAATYFATGLADGNDIIGKMKAPKHAEKLVAEHQAALAKLLFEKNPTGTARPLAQLLSQTEEGKEELGRKRKFHYKGNEKKIVEAVSDPEEEIHIFEPRDTFAEEMNRRSEAVFYLVCDFLFPDRMANEVTEASSASKIRQTSAARNPGSK